MKRADFINFNFLSGKVETSPAFSGKILPNHVCFCPTV